MGSNIYCLPLNEEVRNHLQEIRPNESIPQEETRSLTYEDLWLILDRLKLWGWTIKGDYKSFKKIDLEISKEINGDKEQNIYLTLWIEEDNGKPNLMFHKGRHSVGLFIVREIAKLCGSQCVFDERGEIYIVTGEMDLTILMSKWLQENLYDENYWQQKK